MNLIMERASVRHFQDRPVEPEKLQSVLRAAMQAPTAHNLQPWEFLVVTGKGALTALAGMSPYAGALNSAACAILCMGNRERMSGDRDWWVLDLSAATENILLQCTQEGLGAVWLGLYPNRERAAWVRRRFRLPDTLVPFSVVALGYPAGPVRPKDRFDAAKIHYFQEEPIK